jgi:hypothetical protein
MEREFLYSLKFEPEIPQSALVNPSKSFEIKNEKCKALDDSSPFLITRSIKNRSTLVLYKVTIKKGLQHGKK